jgi:DNA polymerase-3 subunit epsilon
MSYYNRPPINELNLFFFDSETGGLRPSSADFVEVACVLTDCTGENVLDEYCAKVFPVHPVDPRAAAINGYTTEKWAEEAIDANTAMVRLLKLARNALFTAHNAAFDWGFFEMAMAKRAMRWPSDYHRIDTVALAHPLLVTRKVSNVKLVTLMKHFGHPFEAAHSALADAHACRLVYLDMMKLYAPLFA